LDLRLTDHPALTAAVARGGPVIPVFLWTPEEEGAWAPGGASRWWLHHSLAALSSQLQSAGSRLILRRGPALEALRGLAQDTGATSVFWSRRYEPESLVRDARIKSELRSAGIEAISSNSALLFEPWTIQNKSGRPFQVFTPYWKHCQALAEPSPPLRSPAHIPAPRSWPATEPLEALELLPQVPWADGLRGAWEPGSAGGEALLQRFLNEALRGYDVGRDRPDLAGTSRLSPHMHFGEISPRQVWWAVRTALAGAGAPGDAWRSSRFLAEIGWREFAHHLLYHFPTTPTSPLRSDFARFPWRSEPGWLRAWQKGRTGFPIVDAGMRQLWRTGWMHNRVRMIVASFLVKDLLISWQEGARWFWDTLVDADLAQNTLGWQWTAGCGADAAPYFRVFNPTSQGERFDPEGDYVRRWVPELARLPATWIHRPHAAPPAILGAAGVRLGTDYPEPIVSHAIARNVALEAFARLKS
jgi:deoxyribodipyrimidine photo-lyase